MSTSATANRKAADASKSTAQTHELKGSSLVAQVALMGLLWVALYLFFPLPWLLSGLSAAGENVSSVDALGSSSALALSIWSGTAFVVLASCIYFRRDIIIWGVVALLVFLIASGHISLLLMGLCSLFFLAFWLGRQERGVFFAILLVLCGLQMGVALLAYAFSFEQQLTPGFGTRASGVLGSPNTLYPLAVMTLCGFGAVCTLAPSAKLRMATGAGAALAFVVAILTFSRSGWVGIAAAIAVLTSLFSTRRAATGDESGTAPGSGSASRSALVPLAVGLILLLVLGATVVRTQGMVATPSNDLSAATRWSYWQEAARLWKDNLWLGLGSTGFARYSNLEPAPSDPKNLVLQIGVVSGLVGLGLALALGFGIARAAWRVEKSASANWNDKAMARACLLALAAMLAAGLFDTPVFALPDRVPSTLLLLLLAAMTCRIASSASFHDDVVAHAPITNQASLASVAVWRSSARARRLGIALWCGVVLMTGGVGVWGYQRAFGESWSGRCLLVIDGDTLLVQHGERVETVRLWGIDAPESAQPYGALAQRFASERAQNKEITVQVKGYDRYKRALGVVFLANGRVLNEELLKNGLAWWYQYFNPHQHDLAAYQSAAQQRKIGLWSAAQPEAPWDFRRAHHPIGRAPSAPLLQGAPDEP